MNAKSHWQHVVVLAVLYVLIVAVHLVWDARAQRLPTFDQAHHLSKGIEYADALATGRFLSEWLEPTVYPPLYHILLAAGTLVGGADAATGLYVNLLLLAVTLAATYALGSQLAGPNVGLIGSLLFALYPGTAIFTREALQEMCLTAVTVTALAVLVASQGFSRRRASLSLGLVLGLGFLVKPTFGFHLWLPLACASVAVAVRPSRTCLLNAALAAVMAVGVAALWYVPHAGDVVGLSRSNQSDGLALGYSDDLWTGARILWVSFALGLTSSFGQWLGLAACVASAVLSIRRLWPLHASIVGTWLLLGVAIVFKQDKYLLPTLPALAILVAYTITALPVWLRPACVTVVLAAQAVSSVSAQFDWPVLPEWTGLRTASQWGGMAGREPAVPEIVGEIGKAKVAGVQSVALVPYTLRVNPNTLGWESRRTRTRIVFDQISHGGNYSEHEAFRRAVAADWVVLKTGLQSFDVIANVADALNARVRGSPDVFALVRTYPMADGSQAELYKVAAPPIVLATGDDIEQLVTASLPEYRDLNFGSRFRLLGLTVERRTEGFYSAQGIVLRMAWEATSSGPLDGVVGVHLVDDDGANVAGADYPQSLRAGGTVEQGARWIDERLIQTGRLMGATGVGIGLYKSNEPHLAIDRGPRDWNGTRLRISLP